MPLCIVDDEQRRDRPRPLLILGQAPSMSGLGIHPGSLRNRNHFLSLS
jgi:hypothetical protein